MPLTVKTLTRKFRFGSVNLKDPDPSLTPEQVAERYAPLYPELVTARVKGPTTEGDSQIYVFERSIGEKG